MVKGKYGHYVISFCNDEFLHTFLILNSEEENILQEEITSLIQKETVVRVAPNQNLFIGNMFRIQEKDGVSAHYKPETIKQIPFISTFQNRRTVHCPRCNRGDFYMCKKDLKDAYLTVPIIIKDLKFLRSMGT